MTSTYFAVYVSEESGPVDAEGGGMMTCVALFGDLFHPGGDRQRRHPLELGVAPAEVELLRERGRQDVLVGELRLNAGVGPGRAHVHQ